MWLFGLRTGGGAPPVHGRKHLTRSKSKDANVYMFARLRRTAGTTLAVREQSEWVSVRERSATNHLVRTVANPIVDVGDDLSKRVNRMHLVVANPWNNHQLLRLGGPFPHQF